MEITKESSNQELNIGRLLVHNLSRLTFLNPSEVAECFGFSVYSEKLNHEMDVREKDLVQDLVHYFRPYILNNYLNNNVFLTNKKIKYLFSTEKRRHKNYM